MKHTDIATRLKTVFPLACVTLVCALAPAARAQIETPATPAPVTEAPAPATTFGMGGFTAADDEHGFKFGLHVLAQPRHYFNSDGDPDASDKVKHASSGFRMRRMQIITDASLAKLVNFKLQIDVAKFGSIPGGDGDEIEIPGGDGNTYTVRQGGGKSYSAATPFLDDAYVTLKIAEPFQIVFGQLKVPFSAQRIASDRVQLFPERALPINGAKFGPVKASPIALDRDIGALIQGSASRKMFEWQLGLFSGDGVNKWPPADTGYQYVGRLAVNPLGEFPLDEMDFARAKPRLSFGAGATYNTVPAYDGVDMRDGSTADMRLGAETRFAWAGFTAAAEYMTGVESKSGAALAPGEKAEDFTRKGWFVQAGYYISSLHLNPAVRYALLDQGEGAAGGTLGELDLVLNYMIPCDKDVAKNGDYGHNARAFLNYSLVTLDDDSISYGTLVHTLISGMQLAF